MTQTYWVKSSIETIIMLFIFWPIGIVIGLYTFLIRPNMEKTKRQDLMNEIDELDKQLDIHSKIFENKH